MPRRPQGPPGVLGQLFGTVIMSDEKSIIENPSPDPALAANRRAESCYPHWARGQLNSAKLDVNYRCLKANCSGFRGGNKYRGDLLPPDFI